MIGSESINLSLENVWESWFEFKKGKHFTTELHFFQYHLERNLYQLFYDLNKGRYKHGKYRKFIVSDNKRREISVSSVRDRVVHRLVYDYLTPIYDKTFIYDAWSCRVNKGLFGAIERTQSFLSKNPNAYVWKADVKKFFDSVEQKILLKILLRKIRDQKTLKLLKEIIFGFSSDQGAGKGMPIGNLTSQVFANIYFNEFDRFVKHQLKSKAYVRYGDDFVLIEQDLEKLKFLRTGAINFLRNELKLEMNKKSDKIMKARHGLKYLGVKLWPIGRTLNARNLVRIKERLKPNNFSSYSGLLTQHGTQKQVKQFNWLIYEKLLAEQPLIFYKL